jgi:hypothetical protein
LGGQVKGFCRAIESMINATQLKIYNRMHALMEMEMNAVERVDEYLQIDQEFPPVVDTYRPPENVIFNFVLDKNLSKSIITYDSGPQKEKSTYRD